jgi:hypothetical protein
MIQIITNNKCSRCNTADSGKTILMEIPASILVKLNELFHDGKESEKNELSNIEIPIPIWLCELLYKASQKISIDDIGKLIGWFLCHPIQYSTDILLLDSGSNKHSNNKFGKASSSNGFNLKISSSLRMLYEAFPDIPEKTIKQCAKENKFNFYSLLLFQFSHLVLIIIKLLNICLMSWK